MKRRNPWPRVPPGAVGRILEAVSRVAEVEEREGIRERQKRLSPNFANYEAGTERQIPVVILEPAGAGG